MISRSSRYKNRGALGMRQVVLFWSSGRIGEERSRRKVTVDNEQQFFKFIVSISRIKGEYQALKIIAKLFISFPIDSRCFFYVPDPIAPGAYQIKYLMASRSSADNKLDGISVRSAAAPPVVVPGPFYAENLGKPNIKGLEPAVSCVSSYLSHH
jgi:hypothetical protein